MTKKKDFDFSDIFGQNKEKSYYDMLNRKTTMDKVGDAFTDQANSMQPRNVGQRREQALLRGLGVGFGINPEREAKLRELEEQSMQVQTLTNGIKLQEGKIAKKKADNENYFYAYQNDFSVLENFKKEGNEDAIRVMLPTFIDNYKKVDENIGDFVGYQNGKAYFDKGGKVTGVDLTDITQAIIPENQRENYPSLLTYNTRQKVLSTLEEQKLKNDQIRSIIAANNASVRSSDAHAKLYESQAEKAKMEAQNPMSKEEQKTILKTNITSNRKYLEEKLDPKLESSEKMLSVFDDLNRVLIDSPKIVGKDYLTKVRRAFGTAFGLDPNIDYSRLKSIEYEKMLKPLLGAQFAAEEGARVLSKLPSIENDPKALKRFLKEEKPLLIKSIVKLKATKNAYNRNNAINIFDDQELGDLKGDYNNFVTSRYGINPDNKDLLVDTKSKEYQKYIDKGAMVE